MTIMIRSKAPSHIMTPPHTIGEDVAGSSKTYFMDPAAHGAYRIARRGPIQAKPPGSLGGYWEQVDFPSKSAVPVLINMYEEGYFIAILGADQSVFMEGESAQKAIEELVAYGKQDYQVLKSYEQLGPQLQKTFQVLQALYG